MTQMFLSESTLIHEQIITGVAALDDTDPLDLPPLFDSVDPDALGAIFADLENNGPRFGSVTFPYAGYTITVEYDGEPTVTIE